MQSQLRKRRFRKALGANRLSLGHFESRCYANDDHGLRRDERMRGSPHSQRRPQLHKPANWQERKRLLVTSRGRLILPPEFRALVRTGKMAWASSAGLCTERAGWRASTGPTAPPLHIDHKAMRHQHAASQPLCTRESKDFQDYRRKRGLRSESLFRAF